MDDRQAAEPASGTPSESPPIRAAVDALATAREKAFSSYYRNDFPQLVGFLRWQGIPLRDATELAQEAMIEAFRRWDGIEHPRPWTRRVASRAWARRVATVSETPTDDLPEVAPLLTVSDVDIWEQRHHILGLLAALPARQRQVLAWTMDGFTPAEIAVELRMTPEAVRGSLAKARRTLARLITGGQA